MNSFDFECFAYRKLNSVVRWRETCNHYTYLRRIEWLLLKTVVIKKVDGLEEVDKEAVAHVNLLGKDQTTKCAKA